MSSLESQLKKTKKELAIHSKLYEQVSTIEKSRQLFYRICEETSRAMQEHGITELINLTKLFGHIDKDLRENFSEAQLKPTLHEIVVYKFLGLEPKTSHFSFKFQTALEFINDMQNKFLKEPAFDCSKFSKMKGKVRDGVVKKFLDRTRSTVEWKVNFEALRTEWNGEKDALLDDLNLCVQIMKDLRVGLECQKKLY